MKLNLFKTKLFLLLIIAVFTAGNLYSFSFGGKGFKTLKVQSGKDFVSIPISKISDGKAHYYEVKASDGINVKFFVLKSSDGVIRAAIDACDVCYRAGKGYTQDGDFMVCENCGMRFASHRINVVKGGCNPAPLDRKVEGKNLIIKLSDINKNSWYCKYKK